MKSTSGQGFGFSYSYSTTNIVRINNATGALTPIFTFSAGTIISATALAVDLNGDIYFTSDQVAGAILYKFVPNAPPAVGGTLSIVGSITPTFVDGSGFSRNIQFGKLAFNTAGALFTICNYNTVNAGNLPARPYIVNLNKATAAVVSTNDIPVPTGGLVDLPTSGGDLDFSPTGRLFVSGSITDPFGAGIVSIWELNVTTGAILGYKSVPAPIPGSFSNMSGIGFDLQGNVIGTATTNSYIIKINASEFSGATWSGNSSIPVTSVTALNGPLPTSFGDLGSNAFTILGRVYEDVNYGGGAGRPFGTAGTVGIPNARVEVYDASGSLENFTNTLADGSYSIGVSSNGIFYIRVVNSTVRSTRPGNNGTELGVQTFRGERVVSTTLVNIVNEVGGRSPATADPGTGTIGGTTLNTTTFALSGSVTGNAQSVSQATINAANIDNINFGFNFSTIVNTNNTGQGSLRQFIVNSNVLTNAGLDQVTNSVFDPAAGVETSIFMIPDGAAHPGINKPTQLTAAGGGSTALFNITALLPVITDANTSIDGRTQTANIANSQTGVAGSPGTQVGVDLIALPGVQRPEVEIRWNGAAGTAAYGLQTTGANDIIRGIAINRFGTGAFTGANIIGGSSNGLITENIVGGSAVSTNTEAAGSNPGSNITFATGANGTSVTNNIISRADFFGIHNNTTSTARSLTISGNEILNNGNGNNTAGAVGNSGAGIELIHTALPGTPDNNIIINNSIANNGQQGLQVNFGNILTITNNTFSGNGILPSPIGTQLLELDNIGLLSTTNATLTKNVITGAASSGVAVIFPTSASNKISQNSIYNNAGLGIDLDPANGATDVVTPNDNGDGDAGPNGLLNFPVVTSAVIVGTNLVVTGFSGPGTTIELFRADRDGSFSPTPPLSPNPLPGTFTNLRGFGEGRTYLLTLQEGGTVSGITDQDATTGVYTDDGTGVIGNRTENRFRFVIPLASIPGVALNALLTATATDASNNTSEFNGVMPVVNGDMGDAPNSYGTLAAANGPVHPSSPNLRIGATIDVEADAAAVAAGTDANTPNGDGADEDGITAPLPALNAASTTYSLTFPVTNTTGQTANVAGWIDFNRNGTFEAAEGILGTVANNGTSATLTWSNTNTLITGAGLTGGITYARLRITTDPLTTADFVGIKVGGEVEDYSLTMSRAYDLSITKTDNPDPVVAGQALTYTLTVTNNGTSAVAPADIITVTDNLPAGFTANTYTPSAGTYTSGTGAWTGLTLTTGQSATIAIAGTVSPTATGTLNNTAIVKTPAGVVDPQITNDTARQSTTISRVVDLALAKTAAPKPAVAGQALTYTITLTNNGPSSLIPADITTLTDNLPAGFTATTFTPSAGTYTSGTGAWTGLSLATGQSATLTIAGTVSATATGTLTNTVTATPPPGTTDPTPPTATDNTPIDRVVDLALAKTASPKPAIAGQTLTYTITLTNNGPSALVPADVTTLTDNLPAGFTATTFTPSAGTYTSGTGAWTGLSLATGQSATLTIVGTVSATATGTLTNTVTATPPAGTTDPTPPTATDNTTIDRVVDLNLAKTASPKPAVAGQAFTYTITLSNAGPSSILPADVVSITDNLPAGFTASTFTPSAGTYTSGTGAWTGLSLATGQSATLTIAGTVNANFTGTSLTNTVTATPPAGTTDPTPPTATDNTTVNRVMDLALAKTASPKPAVAGNALTYTITLTNNGPATLLPADITTLTDNLPAGFTATSFTPSAGTYTSGTGEWTGLTLTTGQSATITIAGTVSASATGSLTNTVTATPPAGTTDPTPPTATDNTTIDRIIDLNLAKTGSPKPAVTGQAFTYIITLSNAGPGTVLPTDVVTLTDNLPAGFTATTFTPSAGTYNSGAGTWTAQTLAAGQSATLTIAGTIDAGFTGTSLVNTVTATPPAGTTDPTPPTATDNTTVNRVMDLALAKTASPKPAVAGQTLTYTITLTNNGPAALLPADVTTLTDNLPAGFTATSFTPAAGTYTSGTGEWTGLSLTAGQSTTLTIVGTVSATATGTLTNTVTATPPPGATDPTPPTATDNTTIDRIVDLALAKTASPKPALAGQALTYTITLTNNGPAALLPADITTLTDNLPAGFTATTFTPSAGTYTSGTGEWTGLSLGTGQSATLTIAGTVSATATGTLTNTVTATPPAGTTDPTPPTATDNTPIDRVVDLDLAKTASPKPAVAGQTLTYTITLTNNGPTSLLPADVTTVTDNLPAGFTATTYTASAGTYNSGTGAWSGLNLATGQNATLTIVGTVSATATGSLTNTVTATPPTGTTDPTPPTATDNTPIDRVLDLDLAKTASPKPAVAGQALTYTITLTNNGPAALLPADVTTVTDNLPAGFTATTYTPSAGTYNSGTGAWSGLSLAAGQTATLTIAGTVDAGATGSLANTVTATPPTGTTDPTPPTATDNTPIDRILDLGLAKTASPKPAVAGQTLTYTITLTNNGPAALLPADVTTVTDNLPAGFTATTYTPSAGTYNSGTGAWSGLSLTAGQTATLTIVGTVSATATGSLANTVTATPPTGTTDPTPPTATDNTPIDRILDLGLAKTASPKPAVAGQTLTYTITLTNNGPAALLPADVTTVTDNLPAGFTATTYTPSAGTYNSGTGAWSGLSLAAGQTATLTIVGTVNATATGSLANTVTATPPPGTTDPTPPTATDNTPIDRILDLGLAKTASPKPAIAGQALTYIITLTNNGPAALLPADVTTVTDNLPAGFTATSYTPSAGNYTSGTGAWSGLSLAAGQTATLTIAGTVDAGATGSLANTVTATPPPGTTDPTPPTATDNTPIDRVLDLALAKTASPKPAVAGQALTYTITLTNNGPAALLPADVTTVTDNLPAGFTATTYTASAGTYNSGTGAWSGLSLTAGQSATITIAGTVSATATGTLANTVTATPPTGTTDPTPPTATDNTPIDRVLDLGLVKTASPKPAVAGQALTYTITLTNNGPAALLPADVTTVTDNLPAGFTADTYTASAGTYNSATGAWSGLSLAAGQSATITIAGTVNATATGNLTNTVTATPPTGTTDPTPPTGTDNTPIDRIVDLALAKTASPKPAVAGQALTYTITLTNNGPAALLPADITTVTDNLPADFTADTYTPSAGSYNSTTGAWNGLSLAAGQSATLTIVGTVNADATGSLANTVIAVPPTGTTDPTPPTATDNTPIDRVLDLVLAKTASPKPAVAGQTLTYTITLTNNGPAALLPADVTTVTDNLPAGFTATSYTPSAGNYNSGTGAWNGLSLTAGQSATITIVGTLAATATGNITNTVTATPPPGTTDPTPPTATDNTPIDRVLDLGLVKTASPKPAVAGEALTYTITLTNNGPAALLPADVTTVTDNLPAGFTANSYITSAGTFNSTTGAWSGLSLAAGQNAVLTIVGTVNTNATGSLTNTATATPPPGTTDPTPPSTTDVTNLDLVADLAVTKTDGVTTYTPGTDVVYTIVVSNNGPSDVTGATVSDPLPTGITVANWSAVPGAGAAVPANSGSGGINQTVNIPAGSKITYTLTLTVPSGFTGNLSNTASATVPTGVTDNTPGNNTITDTDTYDPQYDLKGVKTAPASVSAGTAIQFTITFTNNGPSDVNDAVITDNVPAPISGVTWTAQVEGAATVATASGAGNNISFNGDIPAGAANKIVLTINGTVQPGATGVLNNEAAITPTGKPPVPTNKTNTTILNTTGINVVKTGPASGSVSAGNTITYHVLVTNAGPSDAVDVVISDVVPATITGVTWVATPGGAATINSGSPQNGTGNNINLTAGIPAGTGNQIDITITGTVPSSTPAGSVTNTATATAAGGNPVSSQVQTNITNDPGLVVVKKGPAVLDAGENITYTIEVTNNGPSDAVGAIVTDNIPAQVLNTAWTSSVVGGATITAGGAGTGNNLNLTANIPAGAGNGIIIVVTGKADPAISATLRNTAHVQVPGKPAIPSNEITTVVSLNPSLQLTKAGPATISGGEQLTYTLVLSNAGPSNVTGAVIADAVPAELSNIVVSTATSGDAQVSSSSVTGNTVNVTGNVAAGSGNTITVTISGKVAADFKGQITNTATVTPPGLPVVTSNPVTTTVTNDPLVQVKKSGPANLSAGLPISYTIEVTNAGPSDAADVAITDNIPAGIQNATWTATATGTGTTVGTPSGTGNVSLTGNIPAGSGNKITITVTGRVDASYSGQLVNTVTAGVPGGTPATANATTNITVDAGINISKSGPAAISAGQQITYTVLVSNSGPSNATNVAITDNVPAQIQNVTWTAVPSGTGTSVSATTGTGSVNVTGNIPAGGGNTITITIHGTVDPAFTGTVNNIATAVPPGEPPVVTPPTTTEVTKDPAIRIAKSGPDNISAGAPVTYTIDVTNSGPSNATGVVIADNVPAGLQNVTWTAATNGTGTTVSAASGTGSINITGDIPAGNGNSIRLTIQGTVDPAFTGTLVNTATAAAPGKTPATSTKNTTVTNDPNVRITKNAPAAIAAGQPITYTIVVENDGPSNATGVAIADNIPAGIQNVTWVANTTGTGTIASPNSGTGNVNITGDIPAGAGNVITIEVKGTVNPALTDATLVNTATATVPGKTPATSTTNTAVDKVSDLKIVKSGPQQVVAGQQVTYNITVTNDGPGDVVAATINDVVPAAIRNVTWTATANGSGTTISAAAGNGNNIALTGNIPASDANSITLVVTGQLDPAFTGTQISNTATATPPPGTDDPTPATSNVTSNVTKETDLVIVKTGPANKGAGQAITYRLEITNNGLSDVTGATIQDIIPAAINGITFTTATNGTASVSNSNLSGHTLNITGNIAAGTGNSIIVDINGTVDAGTPAGDITNTATVTPPAGVTETIPGTNTSNITTAINTDVGLQVSKSGPAIANIGDKITYTIEVTNTGASDATSVDITDPVPAEITNVTWTAVATGNGGTTVSTPGGSGNNIAFTANIEGTTNGPGKVLLTITGTISPASGSSIVNTVTAEFNGEKQSTFTTAVNKSADIRIAKAGPARISAGQQITYTIDVTNAGPADAAGVVIADNVPAQIQNVSWSVVASGGANTPVATGTGNAINLTATIPAKAGSVRVTVTGIVDPAYTGTLINTATATPPASTPDPSPATSTVTTNVENEPGLEVVKSGPATLASGQTITYTVVVRNTGASNATNVTISDVVPAAIEQVSWKAVANGAGANITGVDNGTGNNVTVTGNINAGGTDEIRIVITGVANPSFTGTLTNTATATPQGGTTVSSPPVTTVVSSQSALHMTKSGPAKIAAGQDITYTLVVTNSGPSNAGNINITDNVPAAVTNVKWTAVATGTGTNITGSSTGSGNNITITGNLAAGAANNISVTITGTVDASFNGTLDNTAAVNTPGGTPVTSKVTTTVGNTSGIQVIKSGPSAVNGGEPIVYTIDVTNAGPSNATNVNISDAVPAQIQNVTWTAAATGAGTSVVSGGSGSGNNVQLTANIPAGTGNKITITISGLVDPAFSGTISNSATAVPPGEPPVTSVPVITKVGNVPGLHISKSAPSAALASEVITYTVKVTNSGPGNAIGAVITDAVSAALTNVSWTATAQGAATITAGANGTGNNVSVTGNVPAGANDAIIVLITGKIDNNYSGPLKNVAVVTPPGKPPVPTDTSTTQVQRSFDIQVVKSGPAQIAAGGNITYTVDVTNQGPGNADAITINDVVPADITVQNWSIATISGTATVTGPTSGTGNNINIQTSLSSGGQVRVTITGIVKQTANSTVTNTANVTLPPGVVDPTPDNSSTVVTKVVREPGVRLSKTGPATVRAGETFSYVVEATNLGPSDATGVQITDVVPADLQQVTWLATAAGNATITSGANGTGNNVSLTGNIGAGTGNLIRILITGKVPADFGGTLSNTATANVPGVTPPVTTPPVVTTVTKEADLRITKTGPGTVIQGKNITYVLVVENEGLATVNGATIQDIVPAGIGNVTATVAAQSGGASGTVLQVNNNTVSGTIANIPAGGAVNIEIKGVVNDINTLRNTATVTPPADVKDPVPGNNTSTTVETQVIPSAKLRIRKSVSPAGPYSAGQQITYTLDIQNDGPGAVNPVKVTDVLSGAATGAVVLGTPSKGNATYDAATGTISWNAGLLTNGQTATLSYNVTLKATGNLNNVAIVAGPPDVSTPDTARVTIPVRKYADLAVTKTGPAGVIQGKGITYTVEVRNNGLSDANGATIQDVVPAGISNVAATIISETGGVSGTTLNVNGNTVNAAVAQFPAGGIVNIAITGIVTGTTTLSNTATVTPPPDVTDTVPGNNVTPPVVTPVTPTAKLQITKEVTPAEESYNPGQQITYTLKVTNTGAGNADQVLVTDELPAGILSAPTLGTPGKGTASYNTANRVITWTIGDLANGQSTTLTYQVTILETGSVRNVAIAKGRPDVVIPDTVVNIISAGKAADLTIAKGITTNTPYTVGQRIDYSVTISNKGPNTATGVLVTDALPANLGEPSSILADKGNAVYDPASRTIRWNVGSLTNGETIRLTFHVQITGGGDLINTATVKGNEPDPDMSSNTATSRATVGGDLFIPNVITPNGDGKNDRFVIPGLNKYPGSSLFIYNRWGNMVYQSKNYDNKWDGHELNEGTYYYILKLNTPQGERNYKGWIELLR
ncbi:DUF7927 domain-containing protein [Chitinophaga nivalis]|uniref:Gliding motility-associated C-terminal domain-containing protein n=1 Tax=Chitinophaga nivalis TaxID=2991709 RepID=A0ABT3IGQ2_9BACT|nr:gliding motility-associated C-terminal domain-containing protein [Chitinophaga nivalis]MCW3483134.1 gliding motility-associated C-terminal domain-containing protein [Chitinophaga nivalis]